MQYSYSIVEVDVEKRTVSVEYQAVGRETITLNLNIPNSEEKLVETIKQVAPISKWLADEARAIEVETEIDAEKLMAIKGTIEHVSSSVSAAETFKNRVTEVLIEHGLVIAPSETDI